MNKEQKDKLLLNKARLQEMASTSRSAEEKKLAQAEERRRRAELRAPKEGEGNVDMNLIQEAGRIAREEDLSESHQVIHGAGPKAGVIQESFVEEEEEDSLESSSDSESDTRDVKPLELKRRELEKLEVRREAEKRHQEELKKSKVYEGVPIDDLQIHQVKVLSEDKEAAVGARLSRSDQFEERKSAFRESKGANSRSRALLEALTHALDTNNGVEARKLVADFNDSYGSLVAMDYDGYVPPEPKGSVHDQPSLQALESQKSVPQAQTQQKSASSRLMDSSQLLASISGSLPFSGQEPQSNGAETGVHPPAVAKTIPEIEIQMKKSAKKRKGKKRAERVEAPSSSSDKSKGQKSRKKKKEEPSSSDESDDSKPKKKKRKRKASSKKKKQ
ncbi:uncharacterized protein MELLADRAFT_93210 [Melampsora larici-populina 98AG31]|uniref:Uncharacterized protein n=1 Tax=Melampsora larici-populina (strain 98AG31 / pathotype 3-4-7) TaxID=747676 RepID=F4S479_MELLP|nr:uncharacterized protein MELLADRAFT_93210 [Melampsora larici-populina 98AG31]EGG00537.1 hypothetical protein MELLADRAFT_93210 [Melampsora larici-populina 98AG31]